MEISTATRLPQRCSIIGILLVEDTDTDAKLIFRMPRKGHLINTITRVRDGVEAFEFVRCDGPYSDRPGACQH